MKKEDIEAFAGVHTVIQKEDGSFDITLENPDAGQDIFNQATKDGYIPMFNQQPPTLEEIFKWKAGAVNE